MADNETGPVQTNLYAKAGCEAFARGECPKDAQSCALDHHENLDPRMVKAEGVEFQFSTETKVACNRCLSKGLEVRSGVPSSQLQ